VLIRDNDSVYFIVRLTQIAHTHKQARQGGSLYFFNTRCPELA
jgi:hypothetical protein